MGFLRRQELEDRSKAWRKSMVVLILLVDILGIPILVRLILLLLEQGFDAPDYLFADGLLDIYIKVFTDAFGIKFFLFFQISIIALIVGVLWNTDKFSKKKGRKSEVGTPSASGNGEHGTSRWQDDKERDTNVFKWETSQDLYKSGFVLGSEVKENKRRGSKEESLWMDTEDTHELNIGTTRLGKSRKIFLPSIWSFAVSGESMVVTDPKGELYASTKDYLKANGYDIVCINIREPLKGNQWNILDMVNRAIDDGDIPKAVEFAGDISYAIAHQKGAKTSSEPIWENGEMSVIQALVLLASMEADIDDERHMPTVYHLLANYGIPLPDGSVPLIDYIESLAPTHPARQAFAVATTAPLKTRGSFFTQTLTDLRLFADMNVTQMTTAQDHNMGDVGIKKTAVFIVIPDDKPNKNILATLYITQLYETLVSVANKYGGRLPSRVNFLFDEFGNIPPIPNMDSKITVAGGRGMRFLLAVQDFKQLEKLYDKNAQTIMGNCHNWLFLGSQDHNTLKLISDKLGKYTVETENINSSIQKNSASFSAGANISGRNLLEPDEVGRWDKNFGLLLKLGKFPARYPLLDVSNLQANKDYGFLSLADSKTLVLKSQKDVNYVKTLDKNISEDTLLMIETLIKANSHKFSYFEPLEFAQLSSQIISIIKWQSVTTREIHKVYYFNPQLFGTDEEEEEESFNMGDTEENNPLRDIMQDIINSDDDEGEDYGNIGDILS